MSMPNFLIVGAAKSGTSALYAYLRQHPQVFGSEIKEPGFFAYESTPAQFAGPRASEGERQRITDLERYQALFRRVGEARAVGEASSIYLYSTTAPKRIHHYVPDVKLIALLRNPVDRAYSGYRYSIRDGKEPLGSFEEALAAETDRIAGNWHPIWHHKSLGFYAQQLKRYLQLFSRTQFRVYTYDSFQANPVKVLQDVYGFLGIDSGFVPDVRVRHNVSGTPRSPLLHSFLAHPSPFKDAFKPLLPRVVRHHLRRARSVIMERNIIPQGPRMAQETRRSLMQVFRDDILELQTLIDQDLSGWLNPKR
jgi:hypothetical protein